MNFALKRVGVSAWLLEICLLCVLSVHGQSRTRLKGTVLDITGGPVSGTDVTLFSDERVVTTKTNENGEFEFAPLPSDIHYVEARSKGFRTVSIPVTDNTAERVSLPPLEPGLGGGPCGRSYELAPSGSYEESSGHLRLTGTVKDAYGAPLAGSSLTLMKADLNEGLKAFSKGTFAAHVFVNDGGAFQFTDLDPGWYRLTASHDGYEDSPVNFWIARETLTRLLPIYLIRKGLFTCTVPLTPT